MLIYNNGRFSLGNVSFKLPDGIGVDTANEEINGEGLTLVALDNSFTIQIAFDESEENADKAFAHIFDEECSYELIGKIEEITMNSLKGYKAIYEDGSTLNEEYAFDIDECEGNNILNIYVMLRKNCAAYDDSYKSRIVKEILEGIKRE